MVATNSSILDVFGRPFEKKNGHPRPDLFAIRGKPTRERQIEAKYEAAQDSTEFQNIWKNTDRMDADSANNRAVRMKLVPRSRYEVANNGYSDGIAQTHATDLVGIGPKLRMQTSSNGFNQMIEAEWDRWSKAIQLRRKLWCMAHAKHMDGEAIGVMRTNYGVPHPVKIDIRLYETEQCQTPLLPFNISYYIDGINVSGGYIDGIRFDQFGNALWYDILPRHPGAQNWLGDFTAFNLIPEEVPAKFVMHWFLMRRPGQHRGMPECTSTLNVGAASRRWREATLGAAETAADIAALLFSQLPPNTGNDIGPDPVEAMSTLEFQKRMLTALPMGWDARQMKGEHPNATFEAFHKALINEQARPKSMPFNKAACDSSSYNYASGRLDHQTYYGALDVEREDGNDLVLDPLFNIWFDEAVREFGWLGGDPLALSPYARTHDWDWPKHPVADVVNDAKANDSRIRNGSLSLTRFYAESGEDFADELPVMANDYFGDDAESGMTQIERNQQMRAILRNSVFATRGAPSLLDAPDDGAAPPALPVKPAPKAKGAPANA
jgi:capsid protein